jgi:hypothetical protein
MSEKQSRSEEHRNAKESSQNPTRPYPYHPSPPQHLPYSSRAAHPPMSYPQGPPPPPPPPGTIAPGGYHGHYYPSPGSQSFQPSPHRAVPQWFRPVHQHPESEHPYRRPQSPSETRSAPPSLYVTPESRPVPPTTSKRKQPPKVDKRPTVGKKRIRTTTGSNKGKL